MLADVNCTWIIEAPSPDEKVTLTITDMDILMSEDAPDDRYLEVFDGDDTNAPSLGRFRSTGVPPAIRSTGNALMIHLMVSGGSARGFRAVYDFSSSGENFPLTKL